MLEIRPILSALSRHKSATLLMILQIAITFAVVVNSISIIQQRIALMERESGIAESELVAFNINPIGENYNVENNFKADINLIKSMPGVKYASISNMVPISGSGSASTVSITDEETEEGENRSSGFYRGGTETLDTLGVKLASGRNFKESEVIYSKEFVEPKVILVTQSLADKMFPKGDALGSQLYFWGTNATIIGIIETLAGPWPSSSLFMDNLILPVISLNNFSRIMIRIEEDQVSNFLGTIEQKLIERNPNRVITGLRSFKEIKNRSYSDDYAMTKILWSVIILLIVITLLGIVGIVSFNVSQRVKQIGTRRALGARKIDIQRYFITENILVSGLGLAVGSLLSIFFSIYLAQRFNVPSTEWYYYLLGILVMFVVGVIAVWIPAQKAASISPSVATQSV
ncbi:MAG: ABC transporter permease [Kangiellaceae bacterium]